LERLLQRNNIIYSVYAPDPNDYAPSYRDLMSPYLIIETTQLFSNGGCAMTYLQKDWRANPFAQGDLGSIDISVSDTYDIWISALLPDYSIVEGMTRQQLRGQIEALIAQGQGSMRDIQCEESGGSLFIALSFEVTNPSAMTADWMFDYIQLFALNIHRIFGSITIPSGAPVPPPKSNVTYTPDAKDADGGYFVYSLAGFLWWIVDKNFKFQSIVGANIWQEQKDAEANGLPLTAVDYDNLHHYENGMLYDRAGNPKGRYYTERYDIQALWQNAETQFNTFKADNMLIGFRTMCDLYLLFPENDPLFGEISDTVNTARKVDSSNGIQEQIFAKACLMWLDSFKQKCLADDRIRRL
jgi:hypothetical protein